MLTLRLALSRITTYFIVICGLLFVASELGAQPRPSQTWKSKAANSIYLEALGNGFIYTFNYDHRITEIVSARIGLAAPFAAVGMINFLPGSLNSKFELGAGVIFYFDDDDPGEAIHPTFTAGYRYQPNDGGFLFRVGLTPTTIPQLFGSGYVFIPWPGISFGWCF